VKEMESALEAVVAHFKLKWLQKDGGHPLQSLWQRRDELSTHELFFFGHCLEKMTDVDAKWTKDMVYIIKTKDHKERQGAIFEITGLGTLMNDNQIVVPARKNNPGFDGILKIGNDKEMRISIKNYGKSSYKRTFEYECSKVDKQVKNLIKARKIPSVHLLFEAKSAQYPERNNWESLVDSLEEILRNYNPMKPSPVLIDDYWFGVVRQISDYDPNNLHPEYNSYLLQIFVAYHKNDEKNLFDKLDEACTNLAKHTDKESDKLVNVVYIHIPESISIIKCEESVRTYFDLFPDKPITGVILYQPSVTNFLENNSSAIHHCYKMVFKNRVISKWIDGDTISIVPPVGVVSDTPSEALVVVDHSNLGVERKMIDIYGKYAFQKGEYFGMQKHNKNGDLVGSVRKVAAGVALHAVMQPFADDRAFVIEGRLAIDDELLLL